MPSRSDAPPTRGTTPNTVPWSAERARDNLAEAAATIVALACVLVSVTFRMDDPDLWQHLAVGRAIWSLGHVPARELWVWPTYGAPDVTPSWLFRALLWPFWDHGGVTGLFAWRWLTTLATFALLWRAARVIGARGLAVLPVLVLAGLAWRQRTQVRPDTLVGVLLAAQLLLHARVRDGARVAAWGLPLLALAWANAHASYWIGLVLQALFVADAVWRERGAGPSAPRIAPRLALALALSAAVSFVNPGGWRALAQPFEYAFVLSRDPLFRAIGELQPPRLDINLTNGFFLLAIAWPLLALWRTRRRVADVAELGACALFLGLGLSSQRFVGLLALAAAPFVARDLSELLARRTAAWSGALARLPRPGGPWTRAAACAALCVAMCIPEWRLAPRPLGIGLQPQWFPVHACDFMREHGVRGRGFNRFYQGGYLLWRFWPDRDRLPFMDIHQSGTPEDRARYAGTILDPPAWNAIEARHRFDWVMLNRFRLSDTRLNDALDADPRFALVFVDDNAALFVRRDGPMAEMATRFRYRVLPSGFDRLDAVRMRAAIDPDARAMLRAELERAIAASPMTAAARVVLAELDRLDGRPDRAREASLRAIELDPLTPFAFDGLARASLALGLPREAFDAIARERESYGDSPALADLERRCRAAIADLERQVAAMPELLVRRRALQARLTGLPKSLDTRALPRAPADER